MPSLEEMSAWSLDDIEAAIHHDLPNGWTYQRGYDPDRAGWATVIDAEGKVVWETSQIPDERLLLFNVYGWLLTRTATPRHPAWARRTGPTPRPVVGQRFLPGISIPDPEDIDPSEVQSVYGALHKNPKG